MTLKGERVKASLRPLSASMPKKSQSVTRSGEMPRPPSFSRRKPSSCTVVSHSLWANTVFEIRIGREHRMAGGRDDAVVDLKERLLDERGKFCSLRKSRS